MPLQRRGAGQADKIPAQHLGKSDLTAARQFVVARHHEHQPIVTKRKAHDPLRQGKIDGEPDVGGAGRDRQGNVAAFAFLDIDIDMRIVAQKNRQRLRQMFGEARCVGEQMDARLQPPGVAGKIAPQHLDIVQHDAGMAEQAFSRGGEDDPAPAALQQRHAESVFEAPDPLTGRRQRQIGAHGTMGNAARLGNRDEQSKVNQIKPHGQILRFAGFGTAEGKVRKLQIVPVAPIGQCAGMPDSTIVLIAAVLALAGFIKGVIGLGLPTVSIGLLAVSMPPAHALAIVIAPAIVTNVWQTFVGPYLRDILRRLWPMLAGTAIGIWSGAGLMTGPYARYGGIVLGILLVIYALVSLVKVEFSVAPRQEKWVGGMIGLATGLIAAATGVQVIPSMPFMQAIGMEKDELVQALGVFFTTATVALAFNLTQAGLVNASTALPGIVAMAAAFTGMFTGQALRTRLEPHAFRRWFLIAMLLLGIYLAGSAMYKVLA
jgi:uncharacterized membrane protein YfcA